MKVPRPRLRFSNTVDNQQTTDNAVQMTHHDRVRLSRSPTPHNEPKQPRHLLTTPRGFERAPHIFGLISQLNSTHPTDNSPVVYVFEQAHASLRGRDTLPLPWQQAAMSSGSHAASKQHHSRQSPFHSLTHPVLPAAETRMAVHVYRHLSILPNLRPLLFLLFLSSPLTWPSAP